MAQDVVLGNYSPESVDIIISVGQLVHSITGYADGTFVNVSRITPASIDRDWETTSCAIFYL